VYRKADVTNADEFRLSGSLSEVALRNESCVVQHQVIP